MLHSKNRFMALLIKGLLDELLAVSWLAWPGLPSASRDFSLHLRELQVRHTGSHFGLL